MDSDFRRLLAKHAKKRRVICMYRGPDGVQCKNEAISSHTVQNNGALSEIAEGGHVRVLRAKTQGHSPIVEFDLVGKSKASVFPGFCKRHDAEVFRSIEGRRVSDLAGAMLLVAYRSICQEISKEEATLALYKDPELRSLFDRESRRFADSFIRGTEYGLRDLRRALSEHEKAIHGKICGRFLAFFVRFGEPLPFCCASSFAPEFDANGLRILPGDDQDWSLVSWFSGRLGGENVFLIGGFVDDRSHDIEGFLRTFEGIPDDDLSDLALSFSVFYAENTFFKPSWLDSQNGDVKDWMRKQFRDTVPGEAATGAADVFKSKKIVGIPILERRYLERARQQA